MLFFLRKLLTFFTFPFTNALLFIGLGTYLLFTKKKEKARYLVLTGFVLLLFFSIPPIAKALISPLEYAYPAIDYASVPESDAIVVLGGSVARQGRQLPVEETEGSRLIPAVRLFLLKKAPVIIVSGGNPYLDSQGHSKTEADDMAEILIGLGVPDAQILRENQSRTTQENAQYVLPLLKSRQMRSFILVTSAFHMPRSALHFQSPDFKISYVPTSHYSGTAPLHLHSYLPGADGLFLSSYATKEYLGYVLARVQKALTP